MHIVRAAGIEGFQQLVNSMGCNPNELLRTVDLEPSVIRQPDIYVSYEKVAELLRNSASQCNDAHVARVFNLHPRVLQQRLSQRSTSFQRLLDEMRSKIARQYLQYTRMSLTDIALNLGFAELAVFSRAFKR